MKKQFLPTQLKDYYRFFQVPARRWWFGLIGLVATLVLLVGYLLLLSLLPGAERPESIGVWEYPIQHIAGNLIIAGFVGVATLVAWIFYRQGFGWLSSVVGRFRWKWFTQIIIVCSIGFFLLNVCDFLFGTMPEGLERAVRPYTVSMIVAILLTTPLQAAGEEFVFRGILGRLMAASVPSRKVGLVLSALIPTLFFMVLHQDEYIFNNILYITISLTAWWLAYRTGGIEASIALHAGINVFSQLAAMPFINLAELPERVDGDLFSFLSSMSVLIILTFVIDLLARRRGLVRMSSPFASIPEVVKAGKMVIDINSSVESATKEDLPRFDTTKVDVVQ